LRTGGDLDVCGINLHRRRWMPLCNPFTQQEKSFGGPILERRSRWLCEHSIRRCLELLDRKRIRRRQSTRKWDHLGAFGHLQNLADRRAGQLLCTRWECHQHESSNRMGFGKCRSSPPWVQTQKRPSRPAQSLHAARSNSAPELLSYTQGLRTVASRRRGLISQHARPEPKHSRRIATESTRWWGA